MTTQRANLTPLRRGAVGLALLASLGTQSCIRRSASGSLAVNPDFLVVSAIAQDERGTPLAGVEALSAVANGATFGTLGALAISDSSGAVVVRLRDTDLAANATSGNLTLVLSTPAGRVPRLLGTLEVSPKARGSVNLGGVTLMPAGEVSGRVAWMDANGATQALPGAQVELLRAATVTKGDGGFSLQDLPSGKRTLDVVASRADLAPALVDIQVKSGTPTELDDEIVLFVRNSVIGQISLIPPPSADELLRNGTPLRRSFRVRVADQVAFIRFDQKRERLEEEKSPWLRVTDQIDYDFSTSGVQKLHYQFADAEQKRISPIFAKSVDVDLFEGSTGFIIEDGSGRAFRRTVALRIDLPVAAREMRVASSLDALQRSQWRVAESVTTYTFTREDGNSSSSQSSSSGSSSSSSSVGINATQDLFMQFSDGSRPEPAVSRAFKASVRLELFPTDQGPVFQINNGATSTRERLVRLDIRIPPNAKQMRVYELSRPTISAIGSSGTVIVQSGDSTDNLWFDATPVFFYTFGIPGLKNLYLQFRDQDGFTSPTYEQTIRMEPFPADGAVGFVINSGQPTSLSRELSLTLVPPLGAVAYRVFEDPSSAIGNWSMLQPVVPFTVSAVGVRRVFVQYLSADDHPSDAYQQTVFVEPFPPGSSACALDGGAAHALDPAVDLSLLYPPSAAEMLITINTLPDIESVHWQAVRPQQLVTLTRRGLNTVYVQYRTQNRERGQTVQCSIVYDPFPAPMFLGSVQVQSLTGSLVTSEERAVSIWISAPPTAVGYRISTNNLGNFLDSEGNQLPYLAVPATNFSVTRDVLGNAFQFAAVYVQFAAADGLASQPISAGIQLQMFPPSKEQVQINAGALTTNSRQVTLTVNPPRSTLVAPGGVRISEDLATLESGPILPVSSLIPWELSPTLGSKRIYMRWVATDGTKSRVFSSDIELVP